MRIVKAFLEVIVVLAPLYIGIYLSARLGLEYIPLGGDIVLFGGYPQIIGFFSTIFLMVIFIKKRQGGWNNIRMAMPKNWLIAFAKGVVISGIVFVSVSLIINPLIRALFPDIERNMTVFRI